MRWRLEDNYEYEYVDGSDQVLPPVPPEGWPIPDVGEVIKFGGREATVVQIVWDYYIPKMTVRLKNTTVQEREPELVSKVSLYCEDMIVKDFYPALNQVLTFVAKEDGIYTAVKDGPNGSRKIVFFNVEYKAGDVIQMKGPWYA